MTLIYKRERELHVYRGHQPSDPGFIMGHEFTGVVSEVGSQVKTVQLGDRIVCPFTVSWFVNLHRIAFLNR